MATTPTLDPASTSAVSREEAAPSTPGLLVWMATLSPEAAGLALHAVETAFDGRELIVAALEPAPPQLSSNIRWVTLQASSAHQGWVPAARDYADAAQTAQEHNAAYTLVLGAHSDWLNASGLRAFTDELDARSPDLIVPRPAAGEPQGLVNVALLYPLTRALFSTDIHYPLPTDALLSLRMLTRIGAAARRISTAASDALLWPVSEAAVAGFSVREITPQDYVLPHPPQAAFNDLFSTVAGALFADVEAKASYWQRARVSAVSAPGQAAPTSALEVSEEVRSLVENFRLAYSNLSEFWALLLPPQTLLALKRLSLAPPESFSLAPQVWARIVYDFALAYRLRSVNRGHLLGALTPLYLAWVASHVRALEVDPDAAGHILTETAQAFDTERPYIVSRWRWPDRFNP